MGNIRQLPKLYLRGSLATETMRNLTEEQTRKAGDITNQLYDNPLLSGHRIEFVNQLKKTIANDYRDDIGAAQQEYYITLWRGVVHLLYHCSYGFKCAHCDSSTYRNKRKKQTVINRKFDFCPNCQHTKIVVGGKPTFVHESKISDYDLDVQSPIISIKGDQKVEDAEKVFNDPVQLKRFFTEFIWNYFRQIISENKITKHAKERSMISGPADVILFDTIQSLLRIHNIKYYNEANNPNNGYYNLEFETLSATIEFGAALTKLLTKYTAIGIDITININGVKIKDCGGTAPYVHEEVFKSDKVSMVCKNESSNDGEQTSEPIELEADKYASNDDYDQIEAFDAVRKALPDAYTVNVFDILYSRGKISEQFQKTHNASTFHPSNITSFLNGTKKQTKDSMSHIKIQLLRYVI